LAFVCHHIYFQPQTKSALSVDFGERLFEWLVMMIQGAVMSCYWSNVYSTQGSQRAFPGRSSLELLGAFTPRCRSTSCFRGLHAAATVSPESPSTKLTRSPERFAHLRCRAPRTDIAAAAMTSSKDLPNLYDERGRFDVTKAYPNVRPPTAAAMSPALRAQIKHFLLHSNRPVHTRLCAGRGISLWQQKRRPSTESIP
jgi:hypothetical protein